MSRLPLGARSAVFALSFVAACRGGGGAGIGDPGGSPRSPSGTSARNDKPAGPFDPEDAFKHTDDALGGSAPPKDPAVKRGGAYAGFVEEFNRYYTDRSYKPARTIYVSPFSNGNGASPSSAASPKNAIAAAEPGTRIVFAKGIYSGCFEFEGGGGTYDAPIVLQGERNPDGTPGARIMCCNGGRQSCFNFEATSYVAVDGFDLRGGKYGVRAVGADYATTLHSKGIVVMNSHMDGQRNDGVLTGAADWAVFENNVVSNSGEADGHGIYLSNGSDYNIVRGNDLWGNEGATFQINADPLSTCDNGTANEACDAIAGTSEGGRGASDFMLVENNYFHHGTAQGSNFTSVRYSVVRNNVFASWGRHGVSFWSETADASDKQLYNPRLGSHHNRVHHNLFSATNDRHMLQFINNSHSCDVRNNLFVGFSVNGSKVTARPSAVWMETDESTRSNVYANNVYIAGKFDGRSGIAPTETARQDLNVAWFAKLPVGMPSTVADFAPRPGAPFLDKAPRLPSVAYDRDGKPRGNPADVGPFELP
ncbi:MAG: right-handed parallel beta-helix repeat-containing protein [Deltaproteobacteria bacterium]|nr:right-handed parallel beta-helix repeat-containing protein [Deltaproteobacteria bacterium]